ncbi:MAG TPA: hypothetical protein VFO55_09045 [Gemmatimonadaceae bacterium]|nr:hypothetical protein [Gemmatimonadaceae bacterium]
MKVTLRRRVLMLALLGALPAIAGAQSECTPASGAAMRFHIQPVTVGARDTVVRARVCLTTRAPGIGSYMATIAYDSTKMRSVRVDVTGGMQVANARVPGAIRIAGASPGGFATGQLALLTFKPLVGKALGRLTISVTEASTPAGASVLGNVKVQGWPTTAPSAAVRLSKPVVDSISPRAGEVSAEEVTDLVLYGKGFAVTGNVVQFDGAEVAGLLSERGGTVLRFTAPTWIPARGKSAAHRVVPGRVQVRVKHAGGVSNAVTFTVREEGR